MITKVCITFPCGYQRVLDDNINFDTVMDALREYKSRKAMLLSLQSDGAPVTKAIRNIASCARDRMTRKRQAVTLDGRIGVV